MKTEEIKNDIKKCFKNNKKIDDKLACSFDKIAESVGELDGKVDKNTDLIKDNRNLSEGIFDIVKGNSKILNQLKPALDQIPEMYDWFKDVKDSLR